MKGVAPREIPVSTIYRGVIPFIVLQLLGLMAIFFFEELATWLPRQACQSAA